MRALPGAVLLEPPCFTALSGSLETFDLSHIVLDLDPDIPTPGGERGQGPGAGGGAVAAHGGHGPGV